MLQYILKYAIIKYIYVQHMYECRYLCNAYNASVSELAGFLVKHFSIMSEEEEYFKVKYPNSFPPNTVLVN